MEKRALVLATLCFGILTLVFVAGCFPTQKSISLPPPVKEYPLPQNCEELDDKWSVESCYAYKGAYYNDVSLCEKIVDYIIKDRCYFDIAVNKSDLSVCEEIDDQQYRDGCLKSFGIYKKDTKICDMVEQPLEKNVCYENVGLALNETSICDLITGGESIIGCYIGIVRKTKDPSICDMTPPGIDQDAQKTRRFHNQCYHNLGTVLDDPSFCDKIADNDNLKEICLILS